MARLIYRFFLFGRDQLGNQSPNKNIDHICQFLYCTSMNTYVLSHKYMHSCIYPSHCVTQDKK